MQRALGEKSKKGSLTGEEKSLSEALSSSENNIENNMFKDKQGNINKQLLDKYKYITNSYRENVIPYKYNDAIQDYKNALPKNKGKIAKKTVNSLKNDTDFTGQKGHVHPELYRSGVLSKLLMGAGGFGAGVEGLHLLNNKLLGNE